LHDAGYVEDHTWSEQLAPPETADEFASAAVYVIANSGMSYPVAQHVYRRCMAALNRGSSARRVFGHKGKATAMNWIWRERERLFVEFQAAADKLEFCELLPWIGPTTKFHLAKDLGVDVAKPDVHLARLAKRDRTTVDRLCARLATLTGYRRATIDTILWRACATGIINSRDYELAGWRAAFRGKPKIQH
jgi:hypothetical protein